MELATFLLILRVVSALLLLAFLGLVGWFMYRDLALTGAALAAQERPQGTLQVVASDSEFLPVGMAFPLQLVTSIGRASGNHVVLDKPYTSGEHALIMKRGQQWWLEDLGSRNGTLLNDMPLDEAAVITAGDVIRIGGIALKLEL